MSKSRTKNVVLISLTGGASRITDLLFNFILRTIFIYSLGEVYLGLNSVFSTILQVLSLSELGVGSAIIFYMYKPIAEQNIEKVKSFMHFYKKAYQIIGLIIFCIGISLLPVLKYIVNLESEAPINLYWVYLIYLLNSVVSYLFGSYMRSMLVAMQKQYVDNIINMSMSIVSTVVCAAILIATKNYYFYLCVRIGSSIATNFVVRYLVLKEHPYLRDKNVTKLDAREKKQIFKDVKSIFIFRFSATLSNSLNTIIISTMLGTVIAGYSSNYDLIFTSVTGIISIVINSVSASVGNLNATSDTKTKVKVFRELDLINYFIVTVAFCGLACLSNDFINVWLRNPSYVIPQETVIIKAIHMLLVQTLNVFFVFRESMGLFSYGRYRMFVSGIVSLGLSIFMVKYIGLSGVYLASALSVALITFFEFPKILFKHGFQISPVKEYFRAILKILLSCSICALCYIIVNVLLPLEGSITLAVFACKVFLVLVISLCCLIVCFCKTSAWRDLENRLSSFVRRSKTRESK